VSYRPPLGVAILPGVKRLVLIPIMACALLVVPSALAWNHIAYPKHPEGAVLTGAGVRHAQFLLLVEQKADPQAELKQLFTLAGVRGVLQTRFGLRTRAGHVPRHGYRLTCLSRLRVKGVNVWLAAWAAPDSAYDSMKAFSGMVTPRWHGGCIPAGE
jgi:hypothetical protein